MMAFDRAARCNAILSDVGGGYLTITVIFAKETGEAIGTCQLGMYPEHMEQVAREVMYRTCQFLNDAGRTRGFIQREDADAAYANAYEHVMRQQVTRGRGFSSFGGEP